MGDNRVFKLDIKLGDVYQKSLNMDTSLKYFKEAYEAAVNLQDKTFQIDALIRIAEVYFSKGEIEASIEYGNRVENILKDTIYIEGKLELSLYWLKVHYIRNDYYKAREIGNQAIKLCTEKHTLYKGRILNALARLYAEISSVDEHLNLLNQALECFEKENFLRGILGISNNIGAIYSDKLQNNEKALEYFLKVKHQSEHSKHPEFDILASGNIGEIYFKSLKYKEAYSWLQQALVKAKKAHIESLIFYFYLVLSQICLKLNNYNEAMEYFNLANEELENHPDQGEAMPSYYKVASILSLEANDLEKAKVYIKQALEIIGDEELLIKWDSGIIYELIKIKEASTTEEIVDAVEGVKYLLTKYKNAEVILDIVKTVTEELRTLGYNELASTLEEEYKIEQIN